MFRMTTFQLPATLGPVEAAQSLSVVAGQSDNGLVWQVSVGNTDTPLAKPWTTSATVTAGQVMVMPNGNVGRVVSQTGPTGAHPPTATGDTVSDNDVVWRIVPPFKNGFKYTNTSTATDGTGAVYAAVKEAATTTIGDVLLPGATEEDNIKDPSLIHLIAGSGTIVVTAKGLC